MQFDHYKISFSNTVEYHLLLLCFRCLHLYPVLILPNLWTAFDAFGHSGFLRYVWSLFCQHCGFLFSFLTLNVGWLPNSILGFFPFLSTLTPLVIVSQFKKNHPYPDDREMYTFCLHHSSELQTHTPSYLYDLFPRCLTGVQRLIHLKLSFCASHRSPLLDFIVLVVQTEKFWSLAWL